MQKSLNEDVNSFDFIDQIKMYLAGLHYFYTMISLICFYIHVLVEYLVKINHTGEILHFYSLRTFQLNNKTLAIV